MMTNGELLQYAWDLLESGHFIGDLADGVPYEDIDEPARLKFALIISNIVSEAKK